MVQSTVHVELGQFGESTDAFSVDDDLRHRARAIGDDREFLHRFAVEIDADLVVADAALFRKAIAIRRKLSPDNPRQWDDDANLLADSLNAQRRFEESGKILTELISSTRDGDPGAALLPRPSAALD